MRLDSLLSQRSFLLLVSSLSITAVLSGCGAGIQDQSASGSLALAGTVHGGQQPVTGATIHLYAAGTGGLGTAAVDMLNVATPNGVVHYVTSDSYGNFNITGDYACAHSNDQLYIVATGGNPGLAPGVTNPALVMLDALGSCGPLLANAANTYLTINEVTTVAAAWALAPFMTSAANVAATSSNSVGIANAFLDAHLIADPGTGRVATLAPTSAVESGKIYSLANVLASCINSDGTSACSALFAAATPTGGTAPTNTLTAALNIVKNPGQNVAAVFNTITPQAPFAGGLPHAPHDWTMSLTLTGGGLNSPTQLNVDNLGNVWTANYPGSISGFNAQGAPYSATGFGANTGYLSETLGLTVDNNSNIWATNEENPFHGNTVGGVAIYAGVSSGQTIGNRIGFVFDNSIEFPETLANDSNGNILIGNYAAGTVTIYNNSGGMVSGGLGSGHADFISAVTADGAHGVWMANQGEYTITHVDAAGNFLVRPNCCNGANGLGRDAAGNVWISNYYGLFVNNTQSTPGSLSEVAPDGTILLNQTVTGGGINQPAGMSIDASQNVWVSNYRAGTFTEIAGSANTLAAGTAISPSTGYGLDTNLLLPTSIVPDASGNLWAASNGNAEVVMFFGLATPTATPTGPAPIAP